MVARDGLSIGFLRGASLVGLAVLLWFTLQGCESSSTGPAAPVTESIVVPLLQPFGKRPSKCIRMFRR